ncbi:MAG: VIT1/CCC1 family protein, partial [Actinobacteria bacterium]|nr:VIT1/CCC1 family protein [Actinomycetota bacterium]
MGRARDVERYRENLQDEVDSAAVYRGMAESEDSPQLADVYRRLAAAEERHAAFWRERIERAGGTTPPSRPTRRARALRWLAHRGGAGLVLPTVAATERRGQTMYDHQPEAVPTSLPAEERSHARLLRTLQGGGLSGADVARLEGRHRAVGGNALRAAVLGANDGLVSNLSLVMGV